MSSVNGLDLSEDEFAKLKQKDQNVVMFKNVVHIRERVSDYSFTKKIQYVWLTVVTAGLLILAGLKNSLF